MTTIVRRRKLGLTSVRGIRDASTTGIDYANNWEGIPEDDIYIRWGCTSNIPNTDAKVINPARGIHRVADKSGFRLLLAEHNLCPRTFFSLQQFYDVLDPLMLTEEAGDHADFHHQWIVRSQHHAQGRGMWVVQNPIALREAVAAAGPNCYINEFIPKVAEYRVFVCQGRVVWVAQKTPGNPDDVAWNVAKGGRFDNVRWDSWPRAVVENAIASWELTGLHFAGIDVMVDADGRAYCLEANSAPSQTSPYRQSCVAKAFDWMVENNELDRHINNLPVHCTQSGWRGFIHPGVWSK